MIGAGAAIMGSMTLDEVELTGDILALEWVGITAASMAGDGDKSVDVTDPSGSADTGSGWIAATTAVRRPCARKPIPGQSCSNATQEIAPTPTAAAIPD
jgi:hypothetical protein